MGAYSWVKMAPSENCFSNCWKINAVNKNQCCGLCVSLHPLVSMNIFVSRCFLCWAALRECLLIHVCILVSSQHLSCFGRCLIWSLCCDDSEKIHFSGERLACHKWGWHGHVAYPLELQHQPLPGTSMLYHEGRDEACCSAYCVLCVCATDFMIILLWVGSLMLTRQKSFKP